MKKLIMCQGLPGSGKTTWALNECARSGHTFWRVNKDDIRRELEQTGWVWSHENEKRVIEIRDSRIKNAFALGFSVISDDTNFGHKHRARLEQLARENGAQFEIQVFNTSVDECIKRDAQRTGKAHVGEAVIRNMAKQNGLGVTSDDAGPIYTGFAPYVANVNKPRAIICDLDGTLALFKREEGGPGHRGPYDASKCAEDTLCFPVWMVVEALKRYFGVIILYLSGREEKYRAATEEFLYGRNHCPSGLLYMRGTGDKRKDWIVKGELFDQHVREHFNVVTAIDDRTQVVNFWRHLGLKCFQVAEGNF